MNEAGRIQKDIKRSKTRMQKKAIHDQISPKICHRGTEETLCFPLFSVPPLSLCAAMTGIPF